MIDGGLRWRDCVVGVGGWRSAWPASRQRTNELLRSSSQMVVGDSRLNHLLEVGSEVTLEHSADYVKAFQTVQIVGDTLREKLHTGVYGEPRSR